MAKQKKIIKPYLLVRSHGLAPDKLDDMEKEILLRVRKGFMPLGPPVVVGEVPAQSLIQAMILVEEPEIKGIDKLVAELSSVD